MFRKGNLQKMNATYLAMVFKQYNVQSFSTRPQFFCPLNHILLMMKSFRVLVQLFQITRS